MGALTILPVAAFLAIRFNKRFEETVAPSMFGVVFILYLSGLITTLTPGVWICHLLSVAAFGYCVYAWLRQRELFRNHVLTCGLIAYGIFFAYFLLISCGRDLYVGDDLHRWGAAVRDFYIHKDMFNLPDNYDTAYVYPPALPLWNYYSMEVIRGYHDWSSFLSQYMLQAGLALPLFAKLQPGKRRFTVPLLILAILCIPLVTGCYYPYGNLHDGIPQGFLAAYILWKGSDYHFSRSPFDLICCTMGVVFLTLTKEIALSVAVLCVMTLFLAGWKEARTARRMKAFFGSIALMGASCLAALLSWQYYIAFSAKAYAEKVAVEAALLSTDGLVASSNLTKGMLPFLKTPAAVFLTTDSTLPATRMEGIVRRLLALREKLPTTLETFWAFMRMLFNPDSGTMNLGAPLVLSMPCFLLILTLAGQILSLMQQRSPTASYRYSRRLFLLVFLFCIPLSTLARGIILASVPSNLTAIWGEHTDTFSIIGMLFLLYCFITYGKHRVTMILTLLTIFFLLASSATDLITLAIDKPHNTILVQGNSNNNIDNFISDTDRILYISANPPFGAASYDHDLVFYYSYPGYATVAAGGISITPPEDTDAGEYLIQLMLSRGYTMIYFGGGYAAFCEQYRSAFDESQELLDFALYRLLQKQDGSCRLFLIQQDLPNSISWEMRRNWRYHVKNTAQ